MSKFDLFKSKGKGIAAGAMAAAKPILMTTAGVVGAQKFMDFKTLFPNVSPDKFFIKHEGAIKVGAVVVTLAMWKNCPEWAKYLLMGVAIQGGIKAVRQYSMGDAGKAFIEQIGAGAYDEQIMALASDIKNATNEFPTGVAGSNMRFELAPSVDLIRNSSTGVAGMGISDSDINGYYDRGAY